jgi:hypothetical protein
MMAGHVGQRHVVFEAGLEHAGSFRGLRPLLGRQRRQWQGVVGWLVHRPLFDNKLPTKKLCRESALLGKEMSARHYHLKGLADVPAATPTFVVGKV